MDEETLQEIQVPQIPTSETTSQAVKIKNSQLQPPSETSQEINLQTAAKVVVEDVKQVVKPVMETLIETEPVEPPSPRYREFERKIITRHLSLLRDLGNLALEHVVKPFWHATSWKGDNWFMSLYWSTLYFQLVFTGNLISFLRLSPFVILAWSFFKNNPEAPTLRTPRESKEQGWQDWIGDNVSRARNVEELIVWIVGILDGLRNIFSWRDTDRAIYFCLGWMILLPIMWLTPSWISSFLLQIGLGIVIFILLPLCRNFPLFRRWFQDLLILRILGGHYPVEYEEERKAQQRAILEERIRKGVVVDRRQIGEFGLETSSEPLEFLGVAKEERILAEWSCISHFDKGLVAGRFFLTTLHLAFVSNDKIHCWAIQLRAVENLSLKSIFPLGIDVGMTLELQEFGGKVWRLSNFSQASTEVHDVISKHLSKLGLSQDVENKTEQPRVVSQVNQETEIVLPLYIIVSNPELESPKGIPRKLVPIQFQHVTYLITTPAMGGKALPCRRSWSEFMDLISQLQESDKSIPTIVGDVVKANGKNARDVEKRRDVMESWLNQVVKTNSGKTVEFKRFVGWE